MKKLIAVAMLALFAGAVSAAGNAAAGAEKAKTCVACHGPNGNAPTTPDFPRLAGQHADYLLKAMRDYKSGARKNPIMKAQVESLSARDLEDLAAYFAAQKGQLTTAR